MADVQKESGEKKYKEAMLHVRGAKSVQVLFGDDRENVTEGGSTHANTDWKKAGGKAGREQQKGREREWEGREGNK